MGNNLTLTGAYAGVLTKTDFGVVDTAVVTTAWTRLGSYTVQAGEAIELGWGSNGTQSDAVGRIYAKFQTSAPADVNGRFRILIETPDGRLVDDGYIFEAHTNALAASTDRTKQVPFPKTFKAATEDKKIVIEFKADAAATIEADNVTIYIDVTRYTVA